MNARKIIDSRQTETGNTEPVSLQDVKDAIRVTFTEDDTFLSKCITASRKTIENFCSISLIAKTIELQMDVCYQNNRQRFITFELPFCPYVASSLVVQFQNGLKSTDYIAQSLDQNYFLSGFDYPVVSIVVPGVYKFNYTTGYSTVPEDLKRAIKEEVAFRYEHRGDEVGTTTDYLCGMALESCFPYKRMSWL